MEVSIIVICITAIIITFFIFMLFKDKTGGQVEWDTKTGKVKLTKSIQKMVKDKQKEVDDIVENYRNFKPKSSIRKLDAYKEFCFAIAYSTMDVYRDISKFLRHNNITEMTAAEYDKYVNEKIKVIANIYDTHFKKSKDALVNNITITDILGVYRTVIREMIRRFFNTAYQTHLGLNEERLKCIEIISQETENIGKRLNKLFQIMIENVNQALDSDEEGLYHLLLETNNTLIGLWHDVLLEYIFDENKEEE